MPQPAKSWTGQTNFLNNQIDIPQVSHAHLKDNSKSQRKSQWCSQSGFGQSQHSTSIFVSNSMALKNQNLCPKNAVKVQALTQS